MLVIALFHCQQGHVLSKHDFFLGNDNLINLIKLILPSSRVIFQRFEGKFVENYWNCPGLACCQEFDNIFALSCREPKMSRKTP